MQENVKSFILCVYLYLQAVFRGVLVRKWMAETRDAYDTIVKEIENNDQISVHWHSNLPCAPHVTRKRPSRQVKGGEKKNSRVNAPSDQANVKERGAAHLDHKTSGSYDNAISQRADTVGRLNPELRTTAAVGSVSEDLDPQVQALSSVETQTSFCEVQTEYLSHQEHQVPERESESVRVVGELQTIQSDENGPPGIPERECDISVKTSQVIHEENSQLESFNKTDDIEQSLFMSMQNKTLVSSENLKHSDAKNEQTRQSSDEKSAANRIQFSQPDICNARSEEETAIKSDDQRERLLPSLPAKDLSLTNVTSVWDSFVSSRDQELGKPKIELVFQIELHSILIKKNIYVSRHLELVTYL